MTAHPEPLPEFRYHPDPVATGAVEISDATCIACGEARGYIYTGPVYAEQDLDEQICPWCVANGKAHQQLGADFVDALDADGSPPAYLFRCLHCGKLGGYSDCD